MGVDRKVTRQYARASTQRARQLEKCRTNEKGAVAIIFSVTLLFILGLMALAIDLSHLYNRKVDLQAVADASATAAAKQLNGTAAGIDAAVLAASVAAAQQDYDYGSAATPWSEAAIQFSASPTSGWMDAGSARSAPTGVMFTKVDTADMGDEIGSMSAVFLQVLSAEKTSMNTSAVSVVGRSTMNVTPLAICAMSPVAAASRPPSGELVEYGFRRGVAYDLMNLSSNGSSPKNYVINPIDSSTAGANTAPAIVAPFVCAGKMPSLGLVGGEVSVSQPFPIAQLFEHLNSRFGQYAGGACDFRSAPPDANIKSFVFNATSSWMTVTPAGQGAQSLSQSGRLFTVADPIPHPASNTAASYGQMWSYARPVLFSSYTAGSPEPVGGYTAIPRSQWPALYSPGLPQPKSSYPAVTPYMSFAPAFHTAPSGSFGRAVRHRRVLNVPLLDCPAGAKADVLAIGRFFMTIPATSTSIHAEFAGIASEHTLHGSVEIYK